MEALQQRFNEETRGAKLELVLFQVRDTQLLSAPFARCCLSSLHVQKDCTFYADSNLS